MSKRNFALCIVCALTLIGLSACDTPREKGGQVKCDKIEVAVHRWPASTPLFVAHEKGLFRDEGLEVDLKDYPSGRSAFWAMMNGKADLATVAETPVAHAAVDGKPARVVATIAEIKPGISIIARKDRGVSKPDDLRGKTVGVSMGTAAEFYVHIYLITSYIDPDDVHLVNVQPDRLESALLNGEVDGVCVWFPHTLALREKLGSNAVVLSDPDTYTLIWNLTTRRDWLEDNSACLQKFLRAVVKANKFMAEHPKQALAICSRYVEVKPELLKKEWPEYNFTVKLDQSLILNLEDQSRWIMENHSAKAIETPNFMEIIDSASLKQVDPGAVTIIGE